MKKTTTLISLLLFFQICFSQQSRFSKVYYANSVSYTANGMVKSFDGGLIVCGEYDNSSAVMKIDSLGAVQWAYQFGNIFSNETFNSIVRTTDSAYVVAGKMFDSASSTSDLQIVKIDQSGVLLWSKTIYQIENQASMSIQQTFDNGFILTGVGENVSAPNTSIVVVKLSATADVEWYTSFQGGTNANIGNSIKQTPDSGFALVGYVEDASPFIGSGFLCKLSPSGSVQWTNKYNLIFPAQFIGKDLVVTSDGIYSYYSVASDYAIIKTDFNGNDNWKEIVSGVSTPSGCTNCVTAKMKILSNGNLIFASNDRTFPQMSAVVNIDSAGNYNWSQFIYNSVHDVEEADDHGLFYLGNGPLLGVRTTSVFEPQVGIIKADSLGNADICTSTIGGVSVTFGNITQTPLNFTSTSLSINSTFTFPTQSAVSLIEQVGCVDFTGRIADESTSEIKLYPNPVSSVLNIQLVELNGDIDLQIIDVLGQIIFSNKYNLSMSNEIKIDQKFGSGIYSIVINSNDKKVTKKFIVQ